MTKRILTEIETGEIETFIEVKTKWDSYTETHHLDEFDYKDFSLALVAKKGKNLTDHNGRSFIPTGKLDDLFEVGVVFPRWRNEALAVSVKEMQKAKVWSSFTVYVERVGHIELSCDGIIDMGAGDVSAKLEAVMKNPKKYVKMMYPDRRVFCEGCGRDAESGVQKLVTEILTEILPALQKKMIEMQKATKKLRDKIETMIEV